MLGQSKRTARPESSPRGNRTPGRLELEGPLLWFIRMFVEQGDVFGGRLVRRAYVFLDREVKMCCHGFNHSGILGAKQLCAQLPDSVG